MTETADVAVIGSGFAGSIAALVLHKLGFRTVLLERGRHPRFAIGESSTPAADMVLKSLSLRYGLPELLPLTAFGSWVDVYPQLDCGLKRGFSYFHQTPHASFERRQDRRNELLVAASSDDVHSDTHWLREDVDAFLVDCVRDRGIAFYDNAEVRPRTAGTGWIIDVCRDMPRQSQTFAFRVDFIVDASGAGSCVPKALQIADATRCLKTQSRAIYGHFEGVRPWSQILDDRAHCQPHPFACDAAALHHILDEGWLWLLRFRSGRCSAGIVLDGSAGSPWAEQSPGAIWKHVMQKYPSVAEQFRDARLICPKSLAASGRLQRCWSRAAGSNWCLLPHTFGFVDPLHSTGIAYTLCGLEHLMSVLERRLGSRDLEPALQDYEARLKRELILIDRLIAGAYLSRRRFDQFVAFSMLYFVAAVRWEQRRIGLASGLEPAHEFLCADERALFDLVCRAYDRARDVGDAPCAAGASAGAGADEFMAWLGRELAPLRPEALASPPVPNMYWHTAPPRN